MELALPWLIVSRVCTGRPGVVGMVSVAPRRRRRFDLIRMTGFGAHSATLRTPSTSLYSNLLRVPGMDGPWQRQSARSGTKMDARNREAFVESVTTRTTKSATNGLLRQGRTKRRSVRRGRWSINAGGPSTPSCTLNTQFHHSMRRPSRADLILSVGTSYRLDKIYQPVSSSRRKSQECIACL
jgi:hypothetical protein